MSHGRLAAFLDAGIDPGVMELGDLGELDPALIITPPETVITTDVPAVVFQQIKDQWGEMPETLEVPPAISGWPAAVAVRPGNWDMTTEPALYKIAYGDTLSGLSTTYLGDPARFKEIWDMQPDSYRYSHTMDDIFPGEWLRMPDEARNNLLNWLKQGKPTNIKPGDLPPETLKQKGKRYAPYLLAGSAAVGVGALYLAMR